MSTITVGTPVLAIADQIELLHISNVTEYGVTLSDENLGAVTVQEDEIEWSDKYESLVWEVDE